MVQHPYGVDVVEQSFALQVQQAALLLAQLAHLGRCTGTLQSLPGHRQCPIADVDPQNLGTWIEMAEVVGADTGAAAGIQDPWLLRPCWQRPMHGSQDALMAPAPVVPGWWAVLQRITGKRETVVEGADHRSGGVPVPWLSHGGEIG